MAEAVPHVEKCDKCGAVQVNLSGPFPTRTRPIPTDLQRIADLLGIEIPEDTYKLVLHAGRPAEPGQLWRVSVVHNPDSPQQNSFQMAPLQESIDE